MTSAPLSTTAADDSPWEFSRTNPSPRYRALTQMYRELHLNGERAKGIAPEEMFSGISMPACADRIRKMIVEIGARTILDYGAGKGRQYGPLRIKLPDGTEFTTIQAFWGVERIVCYDPGHAPFSALPTEKFDGVICTDVMEHCPEDDLPWILDEIFGYARHFVFGNIASYPAVKHLPNGENAHCTVQPPGWWDSLLQVIAARHPQVRYRFDVEVMHGENQFETVTLQG